MNPRIRTLAEQAGINLPADTEYNGHVHRNAVERFARSIVRECIGLCQESIDDGCVEAEEPMLKIKKHFGVEE